MTIRKFNLSKDNSQKSSKTESNLPAESQQFKSEQLKEKPSGLPNNVRKTRKLNISRIPKPKEQKPNMSKTQLTAMSDLNLEQVVEKSKKIHVLPRERQMKINPAHRNWFIAQLRKANSNEKLHKFAFSLNHKELSLLFPVIATTHNPIARDKIKSIITLRASKTLYFHGWTTWQFIYPDNQLAKILSELCKILIKQKLPKDRLYLDLMSSQKSDTALLPYPHFNWSVISLISEVSLPDSRRFMNNILNYILENNLELDEFFSKYAIYDDLALGKAIKANYQIEKIEYTFKGKTKNERFSIQDFLGLNKSDFSE